MNIKQKHLNWNESGNEKPRLPHLMCDEEKEYQKYDNEPRDISSTF